MRHIRELGIADIDRYTEIAYDAYPSFKDLDPESIRVYKEGVKYIIEQDDTVKFFGLVEDDEIIAVMRLFDFDTNVHGRIIKTSGIGFLGVSLLHKKKKAARDMLEFYETYYLDRSIPIGSLLPFRPDFYKVMGYGFGSKINKYKLPAKRFPACYDNYDMRKVGEAELEGIFELHDKVVSKTHGMNRLINYEKNLFCKNNREKLFAIYGEDNDVKGYILFEFENGKSDNYTINNMNIHQLVYDTPDTLRRLLGFVRKQEEQVNLVIIGTCDENFYHLFNDPRNDSLNYIHNGYLETNTQGVGMMYKVFDVKMAFSQCKYRNYNDKNMIVKFIVKDDFIVEKIEEVIVRFEKGISTVWDNDSEKVDATIELDKSSFSSLFMGVVNPSSLYKLGFLKISDVDKLGDLDTLFFCVDKPQTNTDY